MFTCTSTLLNMSAYLCHYGATEHTHTADEGACRYQDTHAQTETERKENDDMSVKQKYVFKQVDTLFFHVGRS